MKRVRRFVAYKRHWLWYGFSTAVSLSGALQMVIDAHSHPIGLFAIAAFAGVGGLVAQACKPQDIGDGD
jgi:hypothetical protein